MTINQMNIRRLIKYPKTSKEPSPKLAFGKVGNKIKAAKHK